MASILSRPQCVKVWSDIAYKLSNSNCCTADVGNAWVISPLTLYDGCNLLSVLVLQLIHVWSRLFYLLDTKALYPRAQQSCWGWPQCDLAPYICHDPTSAPTEEYTLYVVMMDSPNKGTVIPSCDVFFVLDSTMYIVMVDSPNKGTVIPYDVFFVLDYTMYIVMVDSPNAVDRISAPYRGVRPVRCDDGFP